jgi:DNA-binding transcriptional LysR family regulator
LDYLRDLPLFVAVADLGNFTRAAAKLGMPVSTLSRRIADLEGSIGVRLFDRSTRTVALTDAGRRYLERCQAILDAAHAAHHEVTGMVNVPSGTLRLSIEAEIGPRLVAPVIARYLERFPGVRVDLDLSPRRVDLLAERFDLAVRLGELPDSTLTVRRLARLAGGLYAAPAYLARHGTPARPEALADHRRIHLLHEGDRGDWHLTRAATGVTVVAAAGGLVSANSMTMIRHLARLGVGIAVIDALMATDDVARGALVPVLPDWTLPPMAISLITPARLLPAKTRMFVDMLADAVSGAVGLVP